MAEISPVVAVVALVFGLASVRSFFEAGRSLATVVEIWQRDATSIQAGLRPDGPDELEGTAKPLSEETQIETPFSGQSAVLATYEVEQRRRGDDAGRGWRTVASGALRRRFVVEDETGRVVVNPSGATIVPDDEGTAIRVDAGESLPVDARLRLSTLTEAIDDLDSVLAQGDVDAARRYREGYIAPGEQIQIAGARPSDRRPARRTVDAVVSAAPDGEPFQIATGDEWSSMKPHLGAAAVQIVVGIIAASPIVLLTLDLL